MGDAIEGLRQVEETEIDFVHVFQGFLEPVAASVLFVWVARDPNIVEEFMQMGLPAWLRDLVGVLKRTFPCSC